MKRVLMGLVWFVVSWLLLTIADMIIMGTVISSTSKAVGIQQGVQAGLTFAKAHATLLLTMRLGILVAALLIAVIGTWKGVLPGTRRSAPQPQAGGA
jgi:uncharacterized membrane protein